MVNLERGVVDGGLHRGTGQFGVETFLAHVDWLHRNGKAVTYDAYAANRDEAEYNMAAYFLTNNERDTYRSDFRSTPEDWWNGYDVKLGAAKGARYTQDGLLRRDFANGYVLLNQPGNPTRTVATVGGRGPDGALRNTVTLRGGQGAVVSGQLPPVVVPVLAKPVTNPVSAVVRKVTGRSSSATRKAASPKVKAKARKIARRAVLVKGKVRKAKAKTGKAKVRIQVRRKVGKRWVAVRTATVSVNAQRPLHQAVHRPEEGPLHRQGQRGRPHHRQGQGLGARLPHRPLGPGARTRVAPMPRVLLVFEPPDGGVAEHVLQLATRLSGRGRPGGRRRSRRVRDLPGAGDGRRGRTSASRSAARCAPGPTAGRCAGCGRWPGRATTTWCTCTPPRPGALARVAALGTGAAGGLHPPLLPVHRPPEPPPAAAVGGRRGGPGPDHGRDRVRERRRAPPGAGPARGRPGPAARDPQRQPALRSPRTSPTPSWPSGCPAAPGPRA